MTQPYPSDWPARSTYVKNRDEYECQCCGIPGGPCSDADLDVHHIVPVNRRGTHHTDNLITLCRQCHKAADRHNDAQARTIPIDKPHSLDDYVFEQFRHLMHEEIEAWFDGDQKVWRVPPKNLEMDVFDSSQTGEAAKRTPSIQD